MLYHAMWYNLNTPENIHVPKFPSGSKYQLLHIIVCKIKSNHIGLWRVVPWPQHVCIGTWYTCISLRRYCCYVLLFYSRSSVDGAVSGDLREWGLSFLRSPVELMADPGSGRVSGVRLEINTLQVSEHQQ